MKRALCLAAATVLGLCAINSVEAAPYASLIRISDTSVETSGLPVNITYRLNEAADSVSIVIKDSTNATVATFAGTATAGANSVAWNGTVDNATGAAVAAGTGYKIEITADRNVAAGYVRGTGSGSNATDYPSSTLFTGYSPRDLSFVKDPASDYFGLFLTSSAIAATAPHAGHIVFTSDMLVAGGGNGFASRVLVHPLDPLGTGPGTTAAGTIWGTTFVPGTSKVVASGQTGATGSVTNPAYVVADNTGGTFAAQLANADPDGVLSAAVNPRDIAMNLEGGVYWGYIADTGTVHKAQWDNVANKFVAPAFNLLALTVGTPQAKAVEIDAAGNLYFVVRAGAGTGGAVYRWSAAQIAAITSNSDPKLTEANAQWAVTPVDASFFTATGNWMTIEFDPITDNTYLGTAASDRLYAIGSPSLASNIRTISATDEFFSFPGLVPPRTIGATYAKLGIDIAGNLIMPDPGPERIDIYSRGGNTSVTVPAPTSQTFSIATSSNVSDWTSY